MKTKTTGAMARHLRDYERDYSVHGINRDRRRRGRDQGLSIIVDKLSFPEAPTICE